jgi:hypothetical protein
VIYEPVHWRCDSGRKTAAYFDFDLDRLERLGSMRERGLLTKKEFDQQKAKLLGTKGAPAKQRRAKGRSKSRSKAKKSSGAK